MTTGLSSNSMFEDVITLIRILELIPQNKWTTISEIHERLEAQGVVIHRRTLQRYLKTIRENSDVFQIRVDASSKPYAFCWDAQGRGLHLPRLTVEQALLLRLADEQLRRQVPASLIENLRPLLRLTRRTADAGDEPGGTWLRKLKVLDSAQPFEPPQIRPSVFSAVAESLFGDRLLSIRCRNSLNRPMEAKVMPLALLQKGLRTYLVCRFEGSDDFRHLALNRIEFAEVQPETFERPTDFDLEDYAARAALNEARGRPVKLSILTDDGELVRCLSETPFNLTQTISAADGADGTPRWTVEAVVEDSLLLDGWLAMRRESILSTTKSVLTRDEAEGVRERTAALSAEERQKPRPRTAGEEVDFESYLRNRRPAQFEFPDGFGPEPNAEVKAPADTLLVEDRKLTQR